MNIRLKRGSIVWLKANDETNKRVKILLGDNIQNFTRPFVVITNNTGIAAGPVIQILPLSKRIKKISKRYPFHSFIKQEEYHFLNNDSVVLAEQIITINKKKIKEIDGVLRKKEMKSIDKALRVQLGL